MKFKIKSAGMVVFLLGLAACGDANEPNMFSDNQIPPDVLNAPRIVATPPGVNSDEYPLLGNVPPKPKNFTATVDSAKTIKQMEWERGEAQNLRQQAENPLLSYPPPFLPRPAAQ